MQVWVILEEEKAELVSEVPRWLFKDHSNSLGFIENITDYSSACFTFMVKVFLFLLYFHQEQLKRVPKLIYFKVEPHIFKALMSISSDS